MPQTRLANLSWLDLNDLIEDGVLGQIERVRNQGTVTADFVSDVATVQDTEVLIFRKDQVVQIRAGLNDQVDLEPNTQNEIFLGVRKTQAILEARSSGTPSYPSRKIATVNYSDNSVNQQRATEGLIAGDDLTFGPNQERTILYDSVLDSLVVVNNE